MKRSYPYTGPAAGPSQPTPGGGPAAQAGAAPDYSGYGYGPTAAGAGANPSNDAQQAQWHQQWQQYYAQQAAAAAGAAPSTAQAGMSQPAQQPYARPQQPAYPRPPGAQGYQAPQQQFAAPAPPQGQAQQSYYGQYPAQPQQPGPVPQAPQAAMQSYGGGWQAQQAAPMQPYGAQQPHVAQSPHQNFYGPNAPMNMSPNGPAAKRQRTDHGGMRQPGYGSPTPPRPAAPAGMQHPGGYGPGPRPPFAPPMQRPFQAGPGAGGRGGGRQPMGGPSNMAAPMAAAKSSGTGGQARNQGGGRQGRNSAQNQQARNQQNQQGNSSQGKFSGPVGVNAIGPANGSGRSGYGRAAAGGKGPNEQKANQNGRGGQRQEAQRGGNASGKKQDQKGADGSGRAGETIYNMQKTALAQGRASVATDQPVPLSSKRTFTEFKIKSLHIPELGWEWNAEDDEHDHTGSVAGDEPEVSGSTAEDASVKSDATADKPKEIKRNRPGRKRAESSKDASRLRLCFAANPPPANAPKGPKALISTSGKTTSSNENEIASAEQKSEQREDGPDDERSASIKAEDDDEGQEWSPFSRGPPQSSTNRVGISHAGNRCRLAIDADSINSLTVHRQDNCIDIAVAVVTAPNVKRKDQHDKKKGEEWVVVKGVLLEARISDGDNFAAVPRRELEQSWQEKKFARSSAASAAPESAAGEGQEDANASTKAESKEETEAEKKADDNQSAAQEVKEEEQASSVKQQADTNDAYKRLPPFYRLLNDHNGPEEDKQHPASQSEEIIIRATVDSFPAGAKWVRTGDLAEWLSVLSGMQSSLGADPLQSWVSKIRVADPESPPTLADILSDWSRTSSAGQQDERDRFLEELNFEGLTGVTELTARIYRGERSVQTPSVKDLSEDVQDALSFTAFGASQNHLSVGFLSLIQCAHNGELQSHGGEGWLRQHLEAIILSIPLHLVYRALDSLCREWVDRDRSRRAQEKAKLDKIKEEEAKVAAQEAALADASAEPTVKSEAVDGAHDGEPAADESKGAEAANVSQVKAEPSTGGDSEQAQESVVKDEAMPDVASAEGSSATEAVLQSATAMEQSEGARQVGMADPAAHLTEDGSALAPEIAPVTTSPDDAPPADQP